MFKRSIFIRYSVFLFILGKSFIINNSFLTNLRVDKRDFEALIN